MKLIRVTEVLQRYYDWDGIPPGRLETARTRGIEVHRACFAVARGCWAVCKADIEPFVNSFKGWMETEVQEVHAIEPELKDDALGIIGHPDVVLTIKGNLHPFVVDLKTPLLSEKLWRLQIAAYCHLAHKNNYAVGRCGTLRLSPEGKIAKFDESKDWQKDLAIFLSMLNTHRFLES